MPRPRKIRNVGCSPDIVVYKPAGVQAKFLNWTNLTLDEFEAIRLIDYEGQDQSQVAQSMGVSRPTVTRIYRSARKKIAQVLVEGQALKIETTPEAANQTPACMKNSDHH